MQTGFADVELAQETQEAWRQGKTAREITTTMGDPFWETAGKIVYDPLSAFDLIGGGYKARRMGTTARQAAKHFTEVDPRPISQVIDDLATGQYPRAFDPREIWEFIAVGPRGGPARAQALLDDTTDVLKFMTEDAASPADRIANARALYDLGDANPQVVSAATERLSRYGNLPHSRAGKQATATLRQVDFPAIEQAIRKGGDNVDHSIEGVLGELNKALGENDWYTVELIGEGKNARLGESMMIENNPVKKVIGGVHSVFAKFPHLGWNPAVLVRNIISNVEHVAVDGNLSFQGARRMAEDIKAFGFMPGGAKAGIGMLGVDVGAKMDVRFTPPTLLDIGKEIFKKGSIKKGPILAANQVAEQHTGIRSWWAATSGFFQEHNRYGKAIPTDAVVDGLPDAIRRSLIAQVEGNVKGGKGLREIERKFAQGQVTAEAWRGGDPEVLDVMRRVNSGFTDEITKALDKAPTPEEAANRMGSLFDEARTHARNQFEDAAPLIPADDPAMDDLDLIRQIGDSADATEIYERIQFNRLRRDSAAAMCWNRVIQVPGEISEAATRLAKQLSEIRTQAYLQVDAINVERGKGMIPHGEADNLISQIWQGVEAQRQGFIQTARDGLGPEGQPILNILDARSRAQMDGGIVKQQTKALWIGHFGGDGTTYDQTRAAIEALWDAHAERAINEIYDPLWQALGGNPESGPMALIPGKLTRSPGQLRTDLAAAALDADIPGMIINKKGDFVPNPRLMASIRKDLGIDVKRLNQLTPEQMEDAIRAMRKRAAKKTAEEAADVGELLQSNPMADIETMDEAMDNPVISPAVLSAEEVARLEPLLDQLRAGVLEMGQEAIGTLAPDQVKAVRKWLRSLEPRQNELKMVASRVGVYERDFALHNYGDRRLGDYALSYATMYHYWPSRTLLKWGQRFANNPALLMKYVRYKQYIREKNKDLPEHWRDQVGVRGFAGGMKYFNPEWNLNPLNQYVTTFNDPAKDDGEVATAIHGMEDFLPGSLSPMITIPLGLALASQGKTTAAEAWVGRMSSQTRTLKAVTALLGEYVMPDAIPPGGIEFEPHLWRGRIGFGGDKWEWRRVPNTLYGLQEAGQITPEQFEEANWRQEGDVWEQGLQATSVERAPSQITGAFLGWSAKGRPEHEIDIARSQQAYYELVQNMDSMTPEERKAAFRRFHQDHPSYGTIKAGKQSEQERNTYYVFRVLDRIPPGTVGYELMEDVGLSRDVMDEFWMDPRMRGYSSQTVNRIMAGIEDLGAVLAIPDPATLAAWEAIETKAGVAFREPMLQRDPQYYQHNQQYWDIYQNKGRGEANKYAGKVDLFGTWRIKRNALLEDPELFAVYGGLDDIENAANTGLHALLEQDYPDGERVADEIKALREAGQYDKADQKIAENPWITDYWDTRGVYYDFLNDQPLPQMQQVDIPQAQLRQDVRPQGAAQVAITRRLGEPLTVAPGYERNLAMTQPPEPEKPPVAAIPGGAVGTYLGEMQAAGKMPMTYTVANGTQKDVDDAVKGRMRDYVEGAYMQGRVGAETYSQLGEEWDASQEQKDLLESSPEIKEYWTARSAGYKWLELYTLPAGASEAETMEYMDSMQTFIQEAVAAPVQYAYYYGTKEDFDRELYALGYTELDRKYPGMRELSAQYSDMTEEEKQRVRAETQITSYWREKDALEVFIDNYPPPDRVHGGRLNEAKTDTEMIVAAAVETAVSRKSFGQASPEPRTTTTTTQATGPPITPPAEPVEVPGRLSTWQSLVSQAATATGLDERIIYTVMEIESRGDPNAVGGSFDTGLMQVVAQEHGGWAADRPTQAQLLDPAFNIQTGSQMLAALIEKHGALAPALAEYNTGSPDTTTFGARLYLQLYQRAYQDLFGDLDKQQSSVVPEGAVPGDDIANQLIGAMGSADQFLLQHGDPADRYYILMDQLRAELVSPELQVKLDYYNTLPKGTGDRSQYIRENPEVGEFFAAYKAGKARIQAALGMATDTQAQATAPAQWRTTTRRSYGGGGGGGGYRRRTSRSILYKMSNALIVQLKAYFATGQGLGPGALRELKRLGVSNVEDLRYLFDTGPAPIPSYGWYPTNQLGKWREWS
jgi:hypothetical protein